MLYQEMVINGSHLAKYKYYQLK